jgi:uncharacterized protein (DUF2336 family)
MSANLALLNEVKEAVSNGSVHQRSQMLRHVTDLFVVSATQWTEEDVALFDDVFARLVAEIELSAKALLAVRLAPLQNAPSNIIHMLAFDDEIDVAAPVLEQSERLDETFLIENAKNKGQGHLFAISRRRALSSAVTDVLLARGDQQVAQSTAENNGAKFSEEGFAILVRRSDGDERLAACVGSRPDIPPRMFLKLLAKASDVVRRKLEAAHPRAKQEIRQVVSEVTSRIQTEVSDRSYDDTFGAENIETRSRSKPLNNGGIHAIAKAGKFEEVSAALALMAELPLWFIERAMTQKGAETILIIAKAIGLPWSTARELLSVRDRNGDRPDRPIEGWRASYGQLIPGTAQEIVRYYRTHGRADTNRSN